MDELREKVIELKETWAKIEEAMQVAPDAWKPHLPYSSPVEIGEVVSTIVYLLDRTRAPGGFAPAYRIAKSFATTTINSALSAAKNLEAAQYNHFPPFLTYLNQVLGAFQTMLYFSDSDESRRTIEGLGGKLAEALSLLDTAQKELATKTSSLAETEKLAETIEEKAETISTLEEQVKTTVGDLAKLKDDAQANADEIKENEKTIDELKDSLGTETTKSAELNAKIEDELKKVSALNVESVELRDLIRALLPDAASAGLAESFARRVGKLERTKWIWMSVFLFSIAGLVTMAFMILYQNPPHSEELWQVVLQRLPFTAPLIWLGWFGAVQYGNTVRVQEDYAFKEATAKAFVGYKDHMEHLANIDIEDTKSAMKLLAGKTIEILSHEPLRIYQHSTEDVSPTKSLLDYLKPSSKEPTK